MFVWVITFYIWILQPDISCELNVKEKLFPKKQNWNQQTISSMSRIYDFITNINKLIISNCRWERYTWWLFQHNPGCVFDIYFCMKYCPSHRKSRLFSWPGLHTGGNTGSVLTWLSRPRKMSIIKKRQAQRGDRGIIVTALGYAMNARPGPEQEDIKTQLSQQSYKVITAITNTSPQKWDLIVTLFYSGLILVDWFTALIWVLQNYSTTTSVFKVLSFFVPRTYVWNQWIPVQLQGRDLNPAVSQAFRSPLISGCHTV